MNIPALILGIVMVVLGGLNTILNSGDYTTTAAIWRFSLGFMIASGGLYIATVTSGLIKVIPEKKQENV